MVKNERFLSKKTVKFDKNQQKINDFDQKNQRFALFYYLKELAKAVNKKIDWRKCRR